MWLYKDEYEYLRLSYYESGPVFLYISGNNPLKIKSMYMSKIYYRLYKWYADE
jgi:hypothetical protein